MGDISEMRGLIVLFSVIAVTISLILLIPSQFYTPVGVDEQYLPEPDTLQLVAWNNTLALNLTYIYNDIETFEFDLNGYNYRLCVTTNGTSPNDEPVIWMLTYAQWSIFQWDFDYFSWFDNISLTVSQDYSYLYIERPAIFSTTIDGYDPATFKAKNTKTQCSVTFAYNTTAYGNFTEALKSDDAQAMFFVDWEDRNTSMNALTLISMLLTGGLPNVDPVLSVVFGFMAWGFVAAAAYMIFIFVLRIVGAIFGGGGA